MKTIYNNFDTLKKRQIVIEKAQQAQTEYQKSGELSVLDKAINCWEYVLNYPDFLSSNDLLNHRFNYAFCLHSHFKFTNELKKLQKFEYANELKKLQKSIGIFESVVKQTPKNSPELPLRLDWWGNALLTSYKEHKKNIEDLKKSIEVFQRAIKLSSENSPDLPVYLHSLGTSLSQYYEYTEEIKDLNESIEILQRVVNLSKNSNKLPTYLNSLGNGFRRRYKRLKKVVDYQESINCYKKGWKIRFEKGVGIGSNAAIDMALANAKNWLHLAFGNQNWEEVKQAFENIYQAREEILSTLPAWKDKEIWLKTTQHYSAYAAYALAKSNKLEEAVIALEKGLARLFIKQEKVIKPLTFSDIQAAANNTILVYITATEVGGLALIIQEDTVIAVWLPEFNYDKLREIVFGVSYNPSSGNFFNNKKLDGYLTSYSEYQQKPSDKSKEKWFKMMEETTQWLWQVAMAAIVDKLPLCAKVTLILVGGIGSLPFHLAWKEDKNTPSGKIYAVDILSISYAPNARLLIESQTTANQIFSDTLLAINEPDSSNLNPLTYSDDEVQTACSTFSKYDIIKHQKAIKNHVLDTLSKYNVFHFSCHGTNVMTEPLLSNLAMANGEFICVDDLLKLRLKARLAFLSACETSMKDLQLPDESVNLSVGFLQAGVACVIASIWRVSEISTLFIVARFYELWRQKHLEPPEALRQAQILVRDSTNQEKLDYVKAHFPKEVYKKLRNEIGFSKMDERNFAHPYYWGAFTYTGV